MTATSEPLPIACSLSAGAAVDRTTEWHALLSRALISRTTTHGGVRIELGTLPGIRSQLKRLVAAERECCPFMTMSLDTTDCESLVLTVTAPESAAPILEQMLAGGR